MPLRSSVVRVRWERVGRVALLLTLAAVLVLYGRHFVSYVSTRAQNERAQAVVTRLSREHATLEARVRALESSATIIQRARQLGMTRTGEQPYVMTGEPGG